MSGFFGPGEQGTREQLAIAEFAQALLVIPRTLAVNGAFDATELVAQMRAYHHSSQNSAEKEEFKYTGLATDCVVRLVVWSGRSSDGWLGFICVPACVYDKQVSTW